MFLYLHKVFQTLTVDNGQLAAATSVKLVVVYLIVFAKFGYKTQGTLKKLILKVLFYIFYLICFFFQFPRKSP